MSSSCAVASSTPAVGTRPAVRGRGASTTTPSALSPLNMKTTARRGGSVRVAAATATAADVMEKLDADGQASWESCRTLVMELGLDEEAADKCLIKAFGWGAQNYWRQSKVEEVPDVDDVQARIDYLVEIGIPEDQIGEKVLPKVAEVIGCDIELLSDNVAHIEKNYFMKRNTKNFRNYVLRVPQVLGNNLDCVGDCAGECNRCWARC